MRWVSPVQLGEVELGEIRTYLHFLLFTFQFGNQLTCLEQYLKWTGLPADKASAQSLLKTLEDMYGETLSKHMDCLKSGRSLMDILKSRKEANPDRHKVKDL